LIVSHSKNLGVNTGNSELLWENYCLSKFLKVQNVYKGFSFAIDAAVNEKLDLCRFIKNLGGQARVLKKKGDGIK